MKIFLLSLVLLMTLFNFSARSQDYFYTRANPIVVDMSSGSFQNTHIFTNNGGYINYKFTLPVARTVSFSSCGSTFHSNVYVLGPQVAGGPPVVLGINNSYGPLCASNNGSLVLNLIPGTYYYVTSIYGWPNVTTTASESASITCTPFFDPTGIEVSTDFSTQMGAAFAKLETSRVPYGLLQDIALEQTNLSGYDGVLIADSNRVTMSGYRSIYQTLMSSIIDKSAVSFASMGALDTLALAIRKPGTVVLSALYYKYSKFTADAVNSNRVSVVNNQVVDKYVSGVWQNPYEIHTAFAASPANSNALGKTQQFILPSTLFV
jgi:hypothetical protein